MSKLKIKNLHVSAEDKKILHGINIEFETGKVYAIIGPNGNGKSTLLSSIMGDPNYIVDQGNIFYDDEDITEAEVDERARKGIFLGMQYPPEIAGVNNLELIKTAKEKTTGEKQSTIRTFSNVLNISKKLRIDEDMIEREVNVGFSGGEKKKNELLQMLMLAPKFALLDEIDSGLDVDSINAISNVIQKEKKEDKAFVIISHYKKLYEIIKPDVTIIIKNGKVYKQGDYQLLIDALNKGFDNV